MLCLKKSTLAFRGTLIAVAAALAGCEANVSVELGATAPAEPAITQVLVEIDGVEFREDSGGVETLEFDSPQAVDLMNFIAGEGFRLFTDEQLSDGRYTGVRLLFGEDEDEDNSVVLVDGREYPLVLSGVEAYSEVDFTVDKDDSSSDSIQLTLDLRQSLQFDDDDNDGTVLTPILRSVRLKDAGGLAGNVAESCPANSSLAMYLFVGKDVTPDDRDGTTADPYLTSGVGIPGSSTDSSYAFPFLPEGDYTIASTCRGHEENPASSEDLNFENILNVEIEAETTVTRNIPN